jgi:DNA mismatch repair ATPase MutS
VQVISWSIGTKIEGTAYEVEESSIDHPDFRDDRDHPMARKFAEKLAGARTNLVSTRKCIPINSWLVKISERIGVIDSPKSSKEFCLAHFKTVYAKHEEQIKEIKDWQEMVERAFDDIILLSNVIERMSCVGVPCSLPEFAKNSAFELRNIYPLRLTSVVKELLPFDEFSMNGNIVNLTGKNGSGKTTLLIAALDATIMAMSGLPVPADSMKLPPIKTVLLSFLDRASGKSTYYAKTEKDAMVADIINKTPLSERGEILAIIDELGSATTQSSVMSVVIPTTKWLSAQKVKVVMSTQITELSEYIGKELKGKNLIIKKEEEGKVCKITEGIGEGEPMEIAKETKLWEIINS